MHKQQVQAICLRHVGKADCERLVVNDILEAINAEEDAPEIPFVDNMLLVQQLGLNAVMDITVKARAGQREITVENTGEKIRIDGPSLFFVWENSYGPVPKPGDWIEISARVRTYDDVMSESDEYKAIYNHQHQ